MSPFQPSSICIKTLTAIVQSFASEDSDAPVRLSDYEDRVSLAMESVGPSRFVVMQQIDFLIVALLVRRVPIDLWKGVEQSIGAHWARYCRKKYGILSTKSKLRLPPAFIEATCYPISMLDEFHQWLENEYIRKGRLLAYLRAQARKKDVASRQLMLLRVA